MDKKILFRTKLKKKWNLKRNHKESCAMNDFGVIKFFIFLPFFATPRTGPSLLYDVQKNTVASSKPLLFLHVINIPYSRNSKRDHKERKKRGARWVFMWEYFWKKYSHDVRHLGLEQALGEVQSICLIVDYRPMQLFCAFSLTKVWYFDAFIVGN